MRKEGFLRRVSMNDFKKKKPTGISLFTGAGGMDIGFSRTGFKIRVMVEMEKYYCQTLRANWFKENLLKRDNVNSMEDIKKYINWYHEPEPVILEEDITKLTTEKILEAGNLKIGEATIVFAGSPCQGFSIANTKRNLDDPRNRLIWEFWRVVDEAMPKFFMFENVPGMVYGKNYPIMLEFAEKLANSGYDVAWKILNAADFGVPQNRKRIIMIGKRIDLLYMNPETGRISYHIACVSGKVEHPDWFLKKHGLKPNKQTSLRTFKKPTNLKELLESVNRKTITITQSVE